MLPIRRVRLAILSPEERTYEQVAVRENPPVQSAPGLKVKVAICLLLACLGVSWFAYQLLLVPQPTSYAPNWQGARWIQASDGSGPVAYFRQVVALDLIPDSAFITLAADQTFRLYVNGIFVGSNTADLAQGGRPHAYIYDIISWLRPGANVLAIRVVNSDNRVPTVRASVGIVHGNATYYSGTGNTWQATTQSALAYTHNTSNALSWTARRFSATSWPSGRPVTLPALTPLLTMPPLLYEKALPAHWMSAGAGHEAYFVRTMASPAGVTHAWLRLVVDGTASVFINGKLWIVWNGAPPIEHQKIAHYLRFTHKSVLYHSVTHADNGLVMGIYDISPYLQGGVNTLAVHVSSPGKSAALVGLETVGASLALDLLVADHDGHMVWNSADHANTDWHASQRSADGWMWGNAAALAWPAPLSIGRPGASEAIYLPEGGSARNIAVLPLAPYVLTLLGCVAAVVGLWLLMSLVILRRAYHSHKEALTILSMAYLPAVACEVFFIVIARLSFIPPPFPYNWQCAALLLLLVALGHCALWRPGRVRGYLAGFEGWRTVYRSEGKQGSSYAWGRVVASLPEPRKGPSYAGYEGLNPLEGELAHTDARKGPHPATTASPGHDKSAPTRLRGGQGPDIVSCDSWVVYEESGPAVHPTPRERLLERVQSLLAKLRTHWPLVLLMLLAIPLICYDLSYEPYWQDELTSYFAAKGILAHGLPLLSSGFLYPKGELYSYLLALSMALVGEQHGLLRIISVLAYLISLPLFYRMSSAFFDRKIALLATAMLAFSPFTLLWGRAVRMYELAQLLTILDMYLFFQAARQRDRPRLIYLAIAVLIATYLSHEEIFIILPALVLGVLVASRDAAHRLPRVLYQKHWWIAAAIGAGVISCQLLIAKVSHPPVLGTDQSQQPMIQFTTDNLPYYMKLFFFPQELGNAQAFITINSLLAIAGCVLAFWRANLRARYCAVFFLAALLMLVLGFTPTASRYIYPLLPAFYLLGAYALLSSLRALLALAHWDTWVPRLINQRDATMKSGISGFGGASSPPESAAAAINPQGMTTGPRASLGYGRRWRGFALFIQLLLCASVLILPIFPSGSYNLLVSRMTGLPYHRHFPDYDASGQYVKQHWRSGDIVVSISPAISVLYYIGRVDYFFSVDRALYLFEHDGHITDTPTGSMPLLSQGDFNALLAKRARMWVITDKGLYESGIVKGKRFAFPPDFHLVYAGSGSSVYLRGDE